MSIRYHTTAAGHKLAYQQQVGSAPGVIFCCGYRSDMDSTKATALAEWCAKEGVAFTRFDYRGHGNSEVEFKEFTIGGAMEDALEILDHIATDEQIIVGSSMGAWVALNAARARKGQIRGFVGVASAPDFTERLMFKRFTPEQRAELDANGLIWAHSDYTESDYPITQHFIEEARNHLMLDDVIGLDIPVHLLHGQEDVDVPWETSIELARCLVSEDVTLTLIKDGDHRLNRPNDLALMLSAIERIRAAL